MDFEVIGDITRAETIATLASPNVVDYANAMVVDGGASVRESRKFAFYRRRNSTGRVTLVRSSWHRKTRNENQGACLARHTWQKQQKVYLSASTPPTTRFRSSAGRFTLRCRTRKRSAPVILG